LVKPRGEPGLRTVNYYNCGYARDHGYGDAMLEFKTDRFSFVLVML
jgi:hypothetical protein